MSHAFVIFTKIFLCFQANDISIYFHLCFPPTFGLEKTSLLYMLYYIFIFLKNQMFFVKNVKISCFYLYKNGKLA
ncbi:predicted protein [Listeria monocytogenes FSL J2-071]|nr:predicted protein [Listeria monocytogenes FSL J2-071]